MTRPRETRVMARVRYSLRCARVMAIKPVRIRDAWATRRLAICVRNLKALPRPAQQLVAHLRGDGI